MIQAFELRLRLDSGQHEKLLRLLDAQLGGPEPAVDRVTEVYYDTPEHRLGLERRALAVRSSGDGRVQCLTAPAGDGLGFVRAERSLEGDVPVLPGQPAGNGLVPAFEAELQRTIRPVRLGPDTEVEFVVQAGEVRRGQASGELREAALRLRSGAPADLFALARRLEREVGFTLAPPAGADAGYRLVELSAPVPKLALPQLDASETAEEAFKRVARACVAHLRAHEARLRDADDSLAIHQMRVASRRLRASFSLFREALPEPLAKPVAKELRRFAKRLGDARDWDVFGKETLAPVREALPDDDALATLARQARRARDDAYRKARRAVGAGRYTRLLLDLGYWLAQERWEAAGARAPIREQAVAVLDAAYGDVRGCGELDALGREQLHDLRIRMKRLRYSGEAFASLFPGAAMETFLADCRRLQSLLGHIQDVSVTGALLRKLGTKHDRTLARAAGIVAGWQAAAEAGTRKRLHKTWSEFVGLRPFWT